MECMAFDLIEAHEKSQNNKNALTKDSTIIIIESIIIFVIRMSQNLLERVRKEWCLQYMAFYRSLDLKQPSVSLGELSRQADWQIVKDNPDIPWSMFNLSANPRITLSEIINNPGFYWNWEVISGANNFTWEEIKEHLYEPWNYLDIVKRKDVPWKDVQRTRALAMYFYASPNIPFSHLIKFAILSNDYRDAIVKHKDLTIQDIMEYNASIWDWYAISRHKNITIDIIKDNLCLFWSWCDISRANPNVTMAIIEANIYLPWVWEDLSERDFVTFDIVLKYHYMKWRWSVITRRFGTPKRITKYPNLYWHYNELPVVLTKEYYKSGNTSIVFNPAVTWSDIKYYKKFILDMENIMYHNPFETDRKRILLELIGKSIAVSKIIRWYRKVTVYDINYEYAHKRAKKECCQIFN
jgi:hypothetical protein